VLLNQLYHRVAQSHRGATSLERTECLDRAHTSLSADATGAGTQSFVPRRLQRGRAAVFIRLEGLRVNVVSGRVASGPGWLCSRTRASIWRSAAAVASWLSRKLSGFALVLLLLALQLRGEARSAPRCSAAATRSRCAASAISMSLSWRAARRASISWGCALQQSSASEGSGLSSAARYGSTRDRLPPFCTEILIGPPALSGLSLQVIDHADHAAGVPGQRCLRAMECEPEIATISSRRRPRAPAPACRC
jgi:hypothetical protein